MVINESCFCTSKFPVCWQGWRQVNPGTHISDHPNTWFRLSGCKFGVFFFSLYIWCDFLRQLNHEAHPENWLWFPCFHGVSCWSCHLSGLGPVTELSGAQSSPKRESTSAVNTARLFCCIIFGEGCLCLLVPFGTHLKKNKQAYGSQLWLRH